MKEVIYIRKGETTRVSEDLLLEWLDLKPPTEAARKRVLEGFWKRVDEQGDGNANEQ